MNDQLDRTLADALRRDAARVPGRGPGFGDVRRRVRQRRQRQVVLGTAPAVLGAAWLVTRPTPASIGVGAGGAVETGDTASTVPGAGTRVECRDAAGNLVLADVSWVDGVATVEVSGSTLPPTTSFGQEVTFPPSGIIHCEMIDAEDILTATTIEVPTTVGLVDLGSSVLCIDASGRGVGGECLQFAGTNQVVISSTTTDRSFVMALSDDPVAIQEAAYLAAALCLPVEPRRDPLLTNVGPALDNFRVAVVLGPQYLPSTIPGGVVATTVPHVGNCASSTAIIDGGGYTTTTGVEGLSTYSTVQVP